MPSAIGQPSPQDMVRTLTRWQIIAACIGLSVGLLTVSPNLQEMFPSLFQNSIISLAAFLISLIMFGVTKALQQNRYDSDLYRASLFITFGLIVMGLLSVLLIAIEIAGRYDQITSIVMAAVSGSIMTVLIMRSFRTVQLARQEDRSVAPSAWLKFLALNMTAMLVMIVAVNSASLAFLGAVVFPLPNSAGLPLMILTWLLAYGIFSKAGTQIDAVAAYLNKKFPQPSQGARP